MNAAARSFGAVELCVWPQTRTHILSQPDVELVTQSEHPIRNTAHSLSRQYCTVLARTPKAGHGCGEPGRQCERRRRAMQRPQSGPPDAPSITFSAGQRAAMHEREREDAAATFCQRIGSGPPRTVRAWLLSQPYSTSKPEQSRHLGTHAYAGQSSNRTADTVTTTTR